MVELQLSLVTIILGIITFETYFFINKEKINAFLTDKSNECE